MRIVGVVLQGLADSFMDSWVHQDLPVCGAQIDTQDRARHRHQPLLLCLRNRTSRGLSASRVCVVALIEASNSK